MLLTSPGSNVPLFMVVIAYGMGIIAAEQYHGRVNAKKVSSFVREHLASMFKKVLTQREIFSAVWLSFTGQRQSQICLG